MGRATHDYAGIAANTNIKAKAVIDSYASAKQFLDDQGGNWRHDLASNVAVERDIGDLFGPISIVLYDTRIITYFPDETFSVRNGGFNTPTTSSRVNQFTPNGYWFYHHKKHLALNTEHGGPNVEGIRLPVVKGE